MTWSDKLRGLGRGIKLIAGLIRSRTVPVEASPPAAEIAVVDGFGDNPGQLRMLTYAPAVTPGRPLIVLLHGCGQDAALFARDSGWMDAAGRLGFTLIMPEQSSKNNAHRCFQWFNPGDTARGMGEAGSIASMVKAAISRFDGDPTRVFIVGLSAGAAMAVAMLAAYPDMFAAGASVAGLPVGSAQTGLQAIKAMASPDMRKGAGAWVNAVRSAAPARFAGAWPRLSVWHGMADATVAVANSELLLDQWLGIRNMSRDAITERSESGAVHRVARGNVAELWLLPDFPHAYPVAGPPGKPVRFVAPAPADATQSIAAFFGIA